MHESITADSLTFAAPGGVGASSFAAPMMSEPMGFRDIEQNEATRAAERLSRGSSRRGHSISFGGGVEELAHEPVAVVLVRSRPGSAGGPTILPGLRDSRAPIRDQDLSNQVSHPHSVNLESEFPVDVSGSRGGRSDLRARKRLRLASHLVISWYSRSWNTECPSPRELLVRTSRTRRIHFQMMDK